MKWSKKTEQNGRGRFWVIFIQWDGERQAQSISIYGTRRNIGNAIRHFRKTSELPQKFINKKEY
jgi:hypothetical protein